ncbi:unnamed protein product [Ranitomeya imitator]|uniref:Histone deacetylase 11 n=1 Tax=Ranitomeya imitator TaxID=111125 RepID=A0ABN9L4D6_9NEOB|nr:unnamed protein product [Ranitomeya imitator]
MNCLDVFPRPHDTRLYEDIPASLWPIVYSTNYNITFIGLEKLHPFDAGKWGKIINFLRDEKLITDDTIVTAKEATEDDLLVVHTRRYINKLKAGKLAIERGWAINVGKYKIHSLSYGS